MGRQVRFDQPEPTSTEFVGTGQNIAMSGGSLPNFTANALENWLNENPYYHIEDPSCSFKSPGRNT